MHGFPAMEEYAEQFKDGKEAVDFAEWVDNYSTEWKSRILKMPYNEKRKQEAYLCGEFLASSAKHKYTLFLNTKNK